MNKLLRKIGGQFIMKSLRHWSGKYNPAPQSIGAKFKWRKMAYLTN
jgi:hypothetical protein